MLAALGVGLARGRWRALALGRPPGAVADRFRRQCDSRAAGGRAGRGRPGRRRPPAGEPVVAAARWDALGLEHYARRHHPELTGDLVLPPAPVPASPTVWVVRRAIGGVKGDVAKLADLDRDLAGRGLRVADEHRLEGRRSVSSSSAGHAKERRRP